MSVFGNIPAFSGFGKPSIKLEFDDNEALLEFQKKMQAAGDDSAELPEVDFDDLKGYGDKYTVIDNRKRAKKEPGELVANKNLLFTKAGKAAENYDKDTYDESKYKRVVIETNFDGTFIEFQIFKAISLVTKNTKLESPFSILEGADGKKYKGTLHREIVKANIKDLYNIIDYIPSKKQAYVTAENYKKYYNDALKQFFDYLKRTIKYYQDELEKSNKYKYSTNHVQHIESYLKEAQKEYNYNIAFYGFNKENLGAAGDTYIITDTRTRARKNLEDTAALKKYDIRKFSGEELQKMQTDDPLLYEQIKSDINTPATITPLMKQYNAIKQKYPDAVLLFNVGTYYETFGDDAKKIAGVLGIKLTNKEGQYYAGFKVRDLEKNLKKLIKAGVKVAVCEQVEQALGAVNYYVKAYYPGLGKTANNAIYNNVGILDWRGFVPTYQILDDYSDFFNIADSKSTFAGFGLDDTKKLIAETCRQHWRDCMAIAKHLKGDSLLQSCFNLWHWLHYNIRYEYDREGREEIRTPLRVWQDRARGVDCDCLSVFSWCVLKCMGYNPAFELVAFKGRPQFSHIFVNCDGVVVDRVWFIFNNRPPLITKSEIYRVNLTNDLAGLF